MRVGAAYLAGAWLLVQIATEILPLFGFPEATGRILVIVLAIGFVPALILAWVFELTPQGPKRESDIAHGVSDARSVRRFDRAIIVVLALAVALFAADRFVIGPAREVRLVATATERGRTEAQLASFADRSVAVLPFEDLSESGDQPWLSSGISEEIFTLLADVPGLRVVRIPPDYSLERKGLTETALADAVNVTYVLRGAVRRAGDRLRITTQLIDKRTSAPVFSQPYDKEIGDVFAVQSEVAASVVEGLRIRLIGPPPAAETTDVHTHELYLQARHINDLLLYGMRPTQHS